MGHTPLDYAREGEVMSLLKASETKVSLTWVVLFLFPLPEQSDGRAGADGGGALGTVPSPWH